MHTSAIRLWTGRLAWLALAGAVAITLWPEPAAELLTPAAGWRVEGDAEVRVDLGRLHHASHFLRDSVRFDDDAGFWRAWTPSRKNVPLRLSSPPFRAAPILSIPVTGQTSGVSGPNALWIEHVASRQRRPLFFGSHHTSLNEVLVVVPPALVGEEVVLRLESVGTRTIGTGSVFAVSWLAAAKSSFLGRLPVLLAAILVYGFFLVVGAAVAAAAAREDLCLPLGLVSLGTVSLATFYAVPLLEAGGLSATVAVRAACIAAGLAGVAALWAVGPPARARGWRRLSGYASLWVGVTLLVAAVCGMLGTGTGHWEPNYRFWPATWSSDHELPWRLAEGIRHGDALATMFGGGWRPTDRPPLMAATYLLIGDVIAALQMFNDGPYLTAAFFNTAAIALNALWIPVAAWLVRDVIGGLSRRAACLVVCFAATVPYSFFTTTYGWPKAFGAAFALACFGLVIQERRSEAGAAARIPCLAALAALSMLAHASTAAFLAPLAVLFATGIRWRRWRPVAVGCLVTVGLLGSWMAYKRVLLPSHEPVLKYALTNDLGIDRPEQGVIAAVRSRYVDMSLGEWLRLKREMLLDAVVPMRAVPTQPLRNRAGDASRLALLRAWDFHVPTFGNAAAWLAALAALAVVIGAGRRRPADPGDAAAVALIAVSVASLAVYVLVCLAPPILSSLPHAAWFGLAIGGGACLARRSPRLFAVLLAAQLLYVGIVWLAHPFMHAITVDVSALVIGAALVAAMLGGWPCRVRRPDDGAGAAATTAAGLPGDAARDRDSERGDPAAGPGTC